jgi:hypothetical protein
MTPYNVAVVGSPWAGSHCRRLAKSKPIPQGVELHIQLAPALTVDIEGVNASDTRPGPPQSCHLERVP